MSERTRAARERGASLIEVVVSLLMASVGLLAVAQLFGVAVLLDGRGRNNTGAARAAQITFEGLRTADFSSASLSATSGGGTTAVYAPGSGASAGGRYNVTTRITDLASSSGTLKEVRVTVAEQSTGGSALLARSNSQAVFVTYRTSAANGQYFDLGAAASTTTSPAPTPSSTLSPTPTTTPTATPSATPPPTPTPSPAPRACEKNEVPASAGCTCQSPMSVNSSNGKCQ